MPKNGGSLGKVLFAEGEYNHPLDPADSDYSIELCPTSKHWRYNLPRTYYITHSLAPLMYITGAVPKRVTAMPVYDPVQVDFDAISRGVPERAAIITTLNDDDSVFRVTGCASFGAHENSYRICAEKGQVENLRDGTDRVKYENDNLSPFYGTDGTEPTIAATARPDYWLSAEGRAEYDRMVEEFLKARRDNEA